VAAGLTLANPAGTQKGLYSFFAGDVGECAHAPRLQYFALISLHPSKCSAVVFLWKSGTNVGKRGS
jgi:hypothetical protein